MLPASFEGGNQALHLESVLQDLPLYHFNIELSYLGSDLIQVFERYLLLPGAVLIDEGQFAGMISRQRLLEYLIRPHGMELFSAEPLWVLHSYAACEMLLLPGDTPILAAAQQALRRSPNLLGEPIVVQIDQSYYLLDIHELNIAHWQIRGIETQVRYERTQAEIIQTHKMASLGRLVDGVAHEILDPTSFIWGNLSHIASYSQELLKLLHTYAKYLPNPPAEITQLAAEMELDYLCQDLPRAIESVQTGAERLSKLASSLQNFCYIDEVYPKPMDLHEAIDSILLLLKSRLSSEIEVIKHYGRLPPVLCYPGQLNQVFMNVLGLAVDALLNQSVNQQLHLDFKARHSGTISTAVAPKPTIEITTQVCSLPTVNREPSRWVSICIADNGPGLSVEELQKILASFSVRQRAEKETSLAVSYQIITAKHGGKFRLRSRAVSLEALTEAGPVSEQSEQREAVTDLSGTEVEILLPLT